VIYDSGSVPESNIFSPRGTSLETLHPSSVNAAGRVFFFFFFTRVTGPRRSVSLKLSDTRVYEPQIRARLGTTAGDVPRGVLLWQAPLLRELLLLLLYYSQALS